MREHRKPALARIRGSGLEIGALHEPFPIPPGARVTYADALTPEEAARLFPEIVDVHEIAVGRTVEHIHLSCHCTLPDDLSMRRVHEVITALEDRFKLECPEVYRVTIHPEPATDNLR